MEQNTKQNKSFSLGEWQSGKEKKYEVEEKVKGAEINQEEKSIFLN